jgi:hypothetical protein
MAKGDKYVLTGTVADGAYLTLTPTSGQNLKVTGIASDGVVNGFNIYTSSTQQFGYFYFPLNMNNLNVPIIYGHDLKLSNDQGSDCKMAISYEEVPGSLFYAYKSISGGSTDTVYADTNDEVRVVYIGMSGFPSTTEYIDGSTTVSMPKISNGDIYNTYCSFFNLNILITDDLGLKFTNAHASSSAGVLVLGYKTKDGA